MNLQPGGSPGSAATAPVAPAAGLAGTWTRSAQLALGVLLGGCLFVLLGKSLLQSLQAGAGTIPSLRIDLNSATTAQLMLLPGVGERLAERIAKYRVDKGPFQRVEDLRRVAGIGPATLERLRDWVYVSTNPPLDPPEAGLPLTVEPSGRPGAKPRKGTNLAGPIDVNTADTTQLMQIPGIGPKLSQRIVDARAQRPFQTVAELRRVSGIGPKTLEKVRPFVTVSRAEAAQR